MSNPARPLDHADLTDRLALAMRAARRQSASQHSAAVHPLVVPTLREMATALLAECEAVGIRVELNREINTLLESKEG